MRLIDTPEMEKLYSVFEPFLTHKPTDDPFISDTPKEAKDAFDKYTRLHNEQKKRVISEFYA